jgi:hypothetical protein
VRVGFASRRKSAIPAGGAALGPVVVRGGDFFAFFDQGPNKAGVVCVVSFDFARFASIAPARLLWFFGSGFARKDAFRNMRHAYRQRQVASRRVQIQDRSQTGVSGSEKWKR